MAILKVELSKVLKSGELTTPIILTNAQFVAESTDGTSAKSMLAPKSVILITQNGTICRVTTEGERAVITVDDDTPLSIGYKEAPTTPYAPTIPSSLVRKDYADNIVIDHENDKTNPHDVTASQTGAEPADPAIQAHIASTSNPHNVSKDQVGLGNVDNTSDIDKPVSTATLQALGNKSDIGHNHDTEYYRQDEFIVNSSGQTDAGKPIKLNGSGKIDATMLGDGSYLVGAFTPVAGTEYPDTTGHRPGAWWLITGVDSVNGYTFTGGDLQGQTAYNGNAMMFGETAWVLFEIDILPTDYYKLDGTQPIEADFAGGGYKISDIADGTEDTDGVSVQQMNQEFYDRLVIGVYSSRRLRNYNGN